MPVTITYLDDPSGGIISSMTPLTKSGTTPPQYLLDPSAGLPTFSYKIADTISKNLNFFSYDKSGLNAVFGHLIWGPYYRPEDSILGYKNSHVLVAALADIYNKYMVQVINLNFRSSLVNSGTKSPTASMIDGALIRQITRLRISNGSKLTLQIIFAVMTLLMRIAMCLVKIRNVLSRSPYSIVSVMALMAGSKMCDPSLSEGFLPSGAAFLDRTMLKRVSPKKQFNLGGGFRVSMGKNWLM